VRTPIAGAFMFGVIMPKGELKDILIEKVEDFVSRFMMQGPQISGILMQALKFLFLSLLGFCLF
jgi:hypothetical protein